MSSAVKLAEIATIIDCEHKTVRTVPEDEAFGFAVGTPSLRTDRIDYSQAKPVDRDTFYEWSQRTELVVGDIIFAREAPAGGLGWVDGSRNVCLGQRTVCVRANSQKIDAKYLYYKLRDPEIQQAISKMSAGSTVHHINVSDIKELQISHIPDLYTQKKISKLLSDLDQLIDLNELIVVDYTNMLKTIFNYWFMQFEFPNAKGFSYKSNGGSFEWSEEIGLNIPTGWKVMKLGECCEIYQPEIISGSDIELQGNHRVYGSNGVIGYYTKYNHEESEIAVSCRGECGNVYRTLPRSWITGNAMVIKPKLDYLDKEFLFHSLRNMNLKNIVTGSVQGQITRGNIENLSILVPPIDTFRQYGNISSNVVNSLQNIFYQNENLQSLKSRILPLLMKGLATLS